MVIRDGGLDGSHRPRKIFRPTFLLAPANANEPCISYLFSLSFIDIQYTKSLVLIALVAGANAFAPATFGARRATAVNLEIGEVMVYGDYDDKMWDNESKKVVYGAWDPASPRSTKNFNPFETFGGNSPDASGIFPGQAFYKDPQRGEASFAQMMIEREEAEARAAAPKAGDAPGAPGCAN